MDKYNNETLNKIASMNTSLLDLGLISYIKKGKKIYIKPENRGKFTRKAKRAGYGVQEYARHVLANKDKYPSSTVKQANFARNFGKKK
jgi:hypothetical protein